MSWTLRLARQRIGVYILVREVKNVKCMKLLGGVVTDYKTKQKTKLKIVGNVRNV